MINILYFIDDVEVLLKEYNIETVVDLRNTEEIVTGGIRRNRDGSQRFYNAFAIAPNTKYPRKLIPSNRVLYEIPLLQNKELFWNFVGKRTMTSPAQKIVLGLLWTIGGQYYTSYLTEKLLDGGFPLFYSILLEMSTEFISVYFVKNQNRFSIIFTMLNSSKKILI